MTFHVLLTPLLHVQHHFDILQLVPVLYNFLNFDELLLSLYYPDQQKLLYRSLCSKPQFQDHHYHQINQGRYHHQNRTIILKIDSFTLSVVGRVVLPGTALSGCPLHFPETTLICCHYLYFNLSSDYRKPFPLR